MTDGLDKVGAATGGLAEKGPVTAGHAEVGAVTDGLGDEAAPPPLRLGIGRHHGSRRAGVETRPRPPQEPCSAVHDHLLRGGAGRQSV